MNPAVAARPATLRDYGALVTGGGSGLGRACAAALAAAGATVTICGRDEDKLRAGVKEIGGSTRFIRADVTDEAQVAAAVEYAAAAPAGLRVVVANAGGGGSPGPLVLTDVQAWNDTLAVNLTGAFLTVKHSAPEMARCRGGSIVVISSIAGVLTHPYLAPYSIAKAAVEMLTRNAADEMGRFGVRVNAIRPGLVPTDATQPFHDDIPTRADYLNQMPLSRLGTSHDIAEAVLFLASDASAWITGQVFGVDGGHSLRRGPDLYHVIGRHFADAEAERMQKGGST
ncbi:hypothetical protein BST36_14720 [Mycolicibacterium moriokaense]|uniref:Short-chain dehydrogenase n=1 Tax=Mycolicibacterium moriokaense TaxID=39691 RepID=A0AAD1H6A1_9MYCO|nr:glucose 1-dehydrogenase [Mycolicibacterium moriokaense]MCV7037854.1 glucose 1-dehydrogenase [Mycolicibacterium moriokaense]ORB22169.1 hypothetical protein BST36_14720 [Mycolicibacterium moriokaense]BBW99203.1 short-chain dehydrogenase [Mycolicibacterium moriokaense]